MPNFKYRAKKTSGEFVEGELEAVNSTAAYLALQKEGFFPTLLEEVKEQKTIHRLFSTTVKRVKRKDLAEFTRGLADLLESGVPLSRALSILKDQVQSKSLGRLILVLYQDVVGGETFSAALAKYPNVFPVLYSNMVYSGEVAGTLPAVLGELEALLESDEEIKAKVQSAMAYPLIMAVVGVGTVWALLAFVIPKIAKMFADMGQKLPLVTQLLLDTSAIVSQFWYVFLIAAVIGGAMFQQFYRTKPGRLFVDQIKLNTPIFKELEIKSEVSRFTRTLSSMLHNGIPILTAIKIVTDILTNQVIVQELSGIQGDLKEGVSLSNALKRCKTIPLAVKNVVAVGEESGNLESSLRKISEAYSREVERTIKTLTSLMEPMMILVMGLIVGFMVVAMLLPIFDLKVTA